MLADLLTIAEVRGSTDFKGMKMAFVGDCQARLFSAIVLSLSLLDPL